MEENKGILIAIDLTRELKKADEIEVNLGDYEFVLKNGKTYFVKKNKYPNTYEECCEIIGYEPDRQTVTGYDAELIENFQKLIICRNAYWKIYGDEIGLNKPWEPDWNDSMPKYTIVVIGNNLVKHYSLAQNFILAFPTEEMRDAFYENFKNEIEECKKFL